MNRVGFDLFRRDDRADIFQKIDAAFLAGAALPLLVLARRTRVAQRGMAARAKPRNIARFSLAFRALHLPILPGCGVALAGPGSVLRPQR
ncbi:MAG TPA: hypothetical protein VEJ46_06695 [Candidatus Acidoferrum sp.]|nr:hypothetical protein [Candidatus Acidoferrum sp.]